jgi:hypothetical protein
MAKSKLIVNYYNNIYQSWHERWWAMFTITQGKGKLKEIITINMVQERLCQLSNFGWSITEYLYTHQKIPKEETWVSFMEFFWELPQNVQALII